ncbi:hypothetical protein D3C72_1073900 [compost metagenome]
MHEKLALLKIASCKAPALSSWRGRLAARVRRYSATSSISSKKTSASMAHAVSNGARQASRPMASSTMALNENASAMGQRDGARGGMFSTDCMG